MPLTPETWLNEQTVNSVTTGNQSGARVIQLANGNLLVVWVSGADSGAGAPAGDDIIGQLFDPLGNPVGDEFLVNQQNFADDEEDVEIAALPGGGFVAAFEDRSTSDGETDIIVQAFDATGTLLESRGVAFSSSSDTYSNPRIAASTGNSVLVVYEKGTGGNQDLMGRIWDPVLDFLLPEISILANGDGNPGDSAVTVLGNGNYVIVQSSDNGTSDGVYFRILDLAGNNVKGFTPVGITDTDSDADINPDVTALANGGFVVTWTNVDSNDRDVLLQVFDSAGNAVSSVVAVGNQSSADNKDFTSVAGLADGGFVVTLKDGVNDRLEAYHFDDAGNALGSRFDFETGVPGLNDLDAAALADGRLAVVWQDGEIRLELLDTRDNANAAAVYTPDTYQIGTVGADTFSASAQRVFGYDGDDSITGDSGNQEIEGGGGADTINGGGGADTIRGGAGNDMMTGAAGDDDVRGLAGADLVQGGVGNDTLAGGAGQDTIVGGDGDDWIIQINQNLTEDIDGGTGIDTLDLSQGSTAAFSVDLTAGLATAGAGTILNLAGIENVIATDFDDSLAGNGSGNHLVGGLGDDTLSYQETTTSILNQDTMEGGEGEDTFRIEALAGKRLVDLAAGVFATGDINGAIDTRGILTGIEHVAVFGAQDIRGDGNDNVLTAFGTGGHANAIEAGAGDDTVDGGDGNDSLSGEAGHDSLIGGDGLDTLDGGGGDDWIDAGAGDDSVLGGDGGDTIDTGDGFDTIDGGLGDDFVTSGAGFDLLIGAAGNDTLLSEIADDTLYGGAGDDLLNGGNNDDLLYGGDDNDKVFGGNGVDTLYGEFGNDTLVGGKEVQSDVLWGGPGDDIVLGQEGEDTLYGEAGDDRVTGGSQSDFLDGGSGNDTLLADGGRDTLRGGEGDDIMTGAGQADLFVFIGAFGNDTITDFVAGGGPERINLWSVSEITDWTDLSANHLSEVGGNAVISDGLGNSITLEGVAMAALVADDFDFTPPPAPELPPPPASADLLALVLAGEGASGAGEARPAPAGADDAMAGGEAMMSGWDAPPAGADILFDLA